MILQDICKAFALFIVSIETKCLEWLENTQLISIDYGFIKHPEVISPDLWKSQRPYLC